jgi:hypothetical protein
MDFRKGPARTKKEEHHRLAEKVGLEKDEHLHQDYEYASGIVERVGLVPLWLKIVYLSLIVWAIYYIIRYWSGE